MPFIPPYLLPRNKLFINGVNFASAGAGALVETRKGSVIDLQTQLGYFKNISRVLREKLGDTEAEALLSKAIYLFSVGGNDYLFPFQTNSSVLYTYSIEQFVGQEIYEVGGRKFGFPSLWPLGCAPFSRTREPDGENNCFGPLTPYVDLHNIEISKVLQKLFQGRAGSMLWQWTLQRNFSCGGRRGVTEYYLCDNVSEYVLFDSSHPTERAYELLAQLAWSGEPSLTGSYNLKALFES
ncbi:hypothetical protein FEM48_Zijuj01G0262400 [Ziziphus jujuba var. spinosa]|uniref:GDSL esterase/lipase 1-like n=1 Tax=Ziziphus jujuba var. spinosa TaxID=714518 RepID=A0A978W4Y4_ZIZJJ|nr:hypothetical protein FEM48_Zijuj01G0262400 [Ziziphus jujuba var. spinosa]